MRTALASLALLVLVAGCSSPPLKPDPTAPKLLDEPYRHPTRHFTISPPKGYKLQTGAVPVAAPGGPSPDASFADPKSPMTALMVMFRPGPSTEEKLDESVERLRTIPPNAEMKAASTVHSVEKVSVSGHEARLVTHQMSVLGLDLHMLSLFVGREERRLHALRDRAGRRMEAPGAVVPRGPTRASRSRTEP